MSRRVAYGLVLALLAMAFMQPHPAHAVPSAFTYQGQLRQGSSVANGPCDFQFGLFDLPAAGAQIGSTISTSTGVANGLFSVTLDFGIAAFTGGARFLEIAVRCPAGSGAFTTLSPRQALTPAPYAIFSPVVVRNADGNIRASMDLVDDGGGLVRTFGPNGNLNTLLSSLHGAPDLGFIGVYDQNGDERVGLQILPSGEGFIETRGPNGNTNIRLTSLTGNSNNGYLSVDDANGNSQAALFVDASGKGQLFLSGMKNFVVDHPTRADTKIVYTSLEGPEAAIYHRGVVRLHNGRATIQLPEHFAALAAPDTITVQLTPGSLESKGLGFSEIHAGRIDIGELYHGTGSYDVHFVVHAVRKGFENVKVEVSAAEFAERFREMRSDGQPIAPPRPAGVSALAVPARGGK
jgi:hypothetical protein